MKKRFTFLIAAMMLLGMMVQPLRAVGQTRTNAYVLDFTTKNSSNSNYTNSWNWQNTSGVNTDNWSLYGAANNSANWAYVRFGGKGGSDTNSTSTNDSYAQSQIAINKLVDKVTINSSGFSTTTTSTFKINSIKLQVSSTSSFSSGDLIDEVTDASISNTSSAFTVEFEPSSGDYWASGSYYKVVINWTAKGTKNNGINITTIVFQEFETTTPIVTATPPSLSGFSYIQGHGPSTQDKYITVSGSNLSANLVVTASDNYEVCKTPDGTYASSVEYEPSTGTVSDETVYVRLKAGLSGGSYDSADDKLTVSSTGATSVTVSLSGSVTPTHTITYSATNGSITGVDSDNIAVATGASIPVGSTVTLTATPSEGYKFDSWSDGGDNSTLSSTSTNPTTFTMGMDDVTVTATFTARTPATVTLHHGAGGNTTTTVNTYTDATLGEIVQTPAAVNGWTAFGWVKSYTSGTPLLIDGSEAVGSTTDLYAVYKKGSNRFELITSTTGLSTGETYMICYINGSTYRFMDEASGNYMSYVEGNTVVDNSYDYAVGKKFVLGGTSGAYTFADNGEYLSATSGQKYLGMASGTPADLQKWSISFESNKAVIANNGLTSDKNVSYHTAQNYFNCYSSKVVYLFKQISDNLEYTLVPMVEKCQVTYTANTGVGDDLIDDNGGSKYDAGATVTVWANEGSGKPNFTKEHYQFINWNTAADGSGTTYTAGATFDISANTTLYAQWDVNKHNITMPTNAYGTYGLSYTYNSSTVTSATDVPYGVEITLNYTPATGYENYVATWSVNGSFITGNTFTMLDEAVAVTVSVEENPYAYATLSSSDMQSMSAADPENIGYGTIKTKTINGLTWETNGRQACPGQSSTPYGMIQLRKRNNGTTGQDPTWIKLPSFTGKIETITLSVTDAGNTIASPSDGGGKCKAIVCFQETNAVDASIVSEGGNSSTGTYEITLDLTSYFYSTGYIALKNDSYAGRIWNISVKYRPYKDMSGTTITTIDADRTVSIPANTNATATDLTIPASSGIIIRSGASLKVSGTLTNSGNENNIIIEDGGQLITSNAVLATAKKNAAAASNWGDGEYTPDGWYFIASPLSAVFNPVETTLLSNNYDLYYLNSENTKWMNYKQETFSLVNGTGYLYANDTDVTIEFAGEIVPYTTEGNAHKVTLTHDGWTLLGNPYTRKVIVDKAFVTLHNAASTTSNDAGGYIMPCRGFAVNGLEGDVVTFTLPDEGVAPNSGNIQIALAQTVASRGESNEQTIDNALVSFNENSTLPKFYFGTQDANIYIPQNGEEYAIVSAEPFGTIPVNFRAEKDGQYTLNIGVEEAEMNYLHLIDNMTGADVDLLVNPSYTFNARNNDYESRFKLVFSSSNTDEAEAQSDFAFISNGNLIVAGTGTLQIVDMMGRTIASYNTSDLISTSDLAQGVYVLRLVNGDNVKTQKIVVK